MIYNLFNRRKTTKLAPLVKLVKNKYQTSVSEWIFMSNVKTELSLKVNYVTYMTQTM